MALTAKWDLVNERLRALERYERMRPTVAAMLRLAAALRHDPRINDAEPGVSLASLNLRLSDTERYVVVAWDEESRRKFEVSFVDPPLEFSETKWVDEAGVIATIVEYLERLRKN
jgi:hypothetical protein